MEHQSSPPPPDPGAPPRPLAGRHRFDLVSQQQLVLERTDAGASLQVFAPDGRVTLAIDITPRGPVVRLEAASLVVRTSGDLVVDAARIDLNARDNLALSSGGDATLRAAGDLVSSARAQTIRSELGDVKVAANDDVRINGERVLVNCKE